MARGRRRMVIWFLLVVGLCTCAVFARNLLLSWNRDHEHDALLRSVDLNSPELRRLIAQRNQLMDLHRPLGAPLAGDWLTAHAETGQTFEAFLAGQIEAPNRQRHRLYVVMIGELTPTQHRIVERTKDYLAACFGVSVETLPAIPAEAIPSEGRRLWDEETGEEQFQTSYILYNLLAPNRPDDALAVLGLTATDLFPAPGWNYVFGEASLTARVGVWSLSRNGDPEGPTENYRLCLRRTVKTALHETGHMVGITHCTAHECCMNGSKSRDESDRRPLEFCPECQAKIWWACGVDPVARCRSLSELAKADGFADDGETWSRETIRLSP